jgi:RNA polymerase sigma-70 factor (ECF subfamily)
MRGEEVARAGEKAELLAGLDDRALLAAAARRDGRAFAELVGRHYDLVHRVMWRMTSGSADTEDIVQDAFLKLWSDPAQVREGAALRSWLIRVASNAAIDRGRKKVPIPLDGLPEPASGAPDALETAMAEGSANEVDSAVAALPERQRLALALVHFEGQSNIDAAAAMDVSIEALESLLARARRGLKQKLAGRWQDILDDLGRLSR